jgi:hypothetical protein
LLHKAFTLHDNLPDFYSTTLDLWHHGTQSPSTADSAKAMRCDVIIRLKPKAIDDFENGKVDFEPVYRLIIKHEPSFYPSHNVTKPCSI